MLMLKYAVSEAAKYIKTFPDLPSTTVAWPQQFLHEEKCRKFAARYTHGKLRMTFTLLEFTVGDDRTITLKHDHRESVRATLLKHGHTLPDATYKPVNAIAQFRQAFQEPNLTHPEWFLSIDLNPESRRADAIARIASLHGSHLHVLVIVTRSKREKAAYFQQLKSREIDKRVGIVIPHDAKLENIRARLYHALAKFRTRFMR